MGNNNVSACTCASTIVFSLLWERFTVAREWLIGSARWRWIDKSHRHTSHTRKTIHLCIVCKGTHVSFSFIQSITIIIISLFLWLFCHSSINYWFGDNLSNTAVLKKFRMAGYVKLLNINVVSAILAFRKNI